MLIILLFVMHTDDIKPYFTMTSVIVISLQVLLLCIYI